MATIINQITTVLVSREEFDSGEYARFPFQYILEPSGTIMYYSKLSEGRFVYSEESHISGLGIDKGSEKPAGTFQSLAQGRKIPGEFFGQIRQFFKDVINLGPSTYEAQTFIVWNSTTESYRVVIPKQEVSAASVRYDIGAMLGSDDTIICDIHSHNDMSAFFSGTDDADDAKNPWISGVFGKLSSHLEYKFRFNDGCGRNFEMDAGDIFDVIENTFVTPSEWLDQVDISTASTKVSSWNDVYSMVYESNTLNKEIEAYGGFGDIYDMFHDPEADLYDRIMEVLVDSSDEECRRIIRELNTDEVSHSTLNEEEGDLFIEIDYILRGTRDLALNRKVLALLLKDY